MRPMFFTLLFLFVLIFVLSLGFKTLDFYDFIFFLWWLTHCSALTCFVLVFEVWVSDSMLPSLT